MSTVQLIEFLLIRKQVIDFLKMALRMLDKHYDTNVSVDQEFVVTLEERIELVTPQDRKTSSRYSSNSRGDPASWPKEVKDMKELERTGRKQSASEKKSGKRESLDDYSQGDIRKNSLCQLSDRTSITLIGVLVKL